MHQDETGLGEEEKKSRKVNAAGSGSTCTLRVRLSSIAGVSLLSLTGTGLGLTGIGVTPADLGWMAYVAILPESGLTSSVSVGSIVGVLASVTPSGLGATSPGLRLMRADVASV